MTYYEQELQRLRTLSYPPDDICDRLIAAKNYITLHFAKRLDLNTLAAQACFSKFHFIRMFKHVYGSTPHQYVTSIRMRRAKQLLQEGKSVKEVCFAVGFIDQSAFSRVYRSSIGKTPASHRKTAT